MNHLFGQGPPAITQKSGAHRLHQMCHGDRVLPESAGASGQRDIVNPSVSTMTWPPPACSPAPIAEPRLVEPCASRRETNVLTRPTLAGVLDGAAQPLAHRFRQIQNIDHDFRGTQIVSEEVSGLNADAPLHGARERGRKHKNANADMNRIRGRSVPPPR